MFSVVFVCLVSAQCYVKQIRNFVRLFSHLFVFTAQQQYMHQQETSTVA